MFSWVLLFHTFRGETPLAYGRPFASLYKVWLMAYLKNEMDNWIIITIITIIKWKFRRKVGNHQIITIIKGSLEFRGLNGFSESEESQSPPSSQSATSPSQITTSQHHHGTDRSNVQPC